MKICFVYFVALWIFFSATPSLSQESGCNERDDKEVEAIYGWPVYLSCQELMLDCDDLYDSATYAYCIMTNIETNETLFNASYDVEYYYADDISYKIAEVTNETATRISVSISDLNGICCSHRVTLKRAELANYTCDEFSNTTESAVYRSLVQGQTGAQVLLCEPRDVSQIELVTDFEVTWYYNCDTALPTGVENDTTNLRINTVDYRHLPGVYTCSVRKDGEERFIRSHHVCVEPPAWADLVTIRCPHYLYHDVGDTLNIDCNIDIGDGELTPERYSMRFYPILPNGSIDVSKDDISCTSFLGGNRTIREDNRVSCIFSYEANATDPKCFSYSPTDLEWETERNKTISMLAISYQIKSLRPEEFLEYFSEVRNRLSGDIENDTTIVREAEHPERRALIIGCTVGGAVLLLIIVAILYFGFRLEIRIWWRHSSFSKVERNPREYGAYLAYYWNREENVAANNNGRLKEMIENVSDFLEKKINCPVYDPARRTPTGERYDALSKAQQNSDRVIIVLSPGYITDPETNFEMYANFHEIPFIFIKIPGVDESIKQMSNERNKNALRIHLKRSVVIDWKPNREHKNNRRQQDLVARNLPKKFRMELELAMPKRSPPVQSVIYENRNVEFRPGNAQV